MAAKQWQTIRRHLDRSSLGLIRHNVWLQKWSPGQKSQPGCEMNASEKSNLFIGVWINKLQPMGAVASAGQTGQHSPDGMIGLVHSFISSQIISSHRTAPLSHTQIRHGSGFHTSLSLYSWASWMQPPASSEETSRGWKDRGGGGEQWWYLVVREGIRHRRVEIC